MKIAHTRAMISAAPGRSARRRELSHAPACSTWTCRPRARECPKTSSIRAARGPIRRRTTNRRRSWPRCSSRTSSSSRRTFRRPSGRPGREQLEKRERQDSLRAGHRARDSRAAADRRPRSSAVAAPRSARAPNTQVCPVCLGLPGALPVLNRRPSTTPSGPRWRSAATCSQSRSSRARTTSIPTCPRATRFPSTNGRWRSRGGARYRGRRRPNACGLTRIHMEEDAGKSLHEGFPDSDRTTYIDFNRSGVPLIEIVTRARHAIGGRGGRVLRAAARHPRLDRRQRRQHGRGQPPLRRQRVGAAGRPGGVRHQGRSEERQLVPLPRRRRSSTRSSGRSIVLEARRPRRAGDAACSIRRTGRTFSMRSKEEAHDYRYFPEPDLPPLVVDAARSRGRARRRCRSCPRRADSGSSPRTACPTTTRAC